MRRWTGLLALVALAGVFVYSQFYAGDEREQLAATQQRIEDTQQRLREQDRRIARLSLSNCTDLKDLTQGVYKLALALQGLAGALEAELQETDPDAKIEIRLEEPEQVECRPGDVVPGKP